MMPGMLFPVSVITDEISQDIRTACRLAAQYGLSAVEIRSVEETPPEKLSEDQLRRIAKTAADYGLKISALCSSVLKCRQGQEDDGQFYAALAAAKKLGCSLLRAFTYFAEPGLDEEALIQTLRRYADIAATEGISLALENEPSVYASNGAKLQALLEKVDRPNVGALWDPGNNLYGEEEPGYPEGYEAVKRHIIHVHLKDAVRAAGQTRGAALCRGEADFAGLFRALLRDGYNGYITLETHYRKAAQIQKELLLRPAGSAFSDGGYEATEECLLNLMECLQAISEEMG